MSFYIGNKSSPVAGLFLPKGLYNSWLGMYPGGNTGPEIVGYGGYFGRSGNHYFARAPMDFAKIKGSDIQYNAYSISSVNIGGGSARPLIGITETGDAYTFYYNNSSPIFLTNNVIDATITTDNDIFVLKTNKVVYRHLPDGESSLGTKFRDPYGIGNKSVPSFLTTSGLISVTYNPVCMGLIDAYIAHQTSNLYFGAGSLQRWNQGWDCFDNATTWYNRVDNYRNWASGWGYNTYVHQSAVGWAYGKDFVIYPEVTSAATATYGYFGRNAYGQLGVNGGGAANFYSAACPISFSANRSLIQAVAGGHHTLITGTTHTTSQAIYAFGRNTYGQLGDGTTTNRFSPVLVFSFDTGSWKLMALGASEYASYFMVAQSYKFMSARLYSMGRGLYGENGNAGVDTSVPTLIWSNDPEITEWDVVNSCLMTAIGPQGNSNMVCNPKLGSTSAMTFVWGRNDWGQLGVGHTQDISTPVLIVGEGSHHWIDHHFLWQRPVFASDFCLSQRSDLLYSSGRNDYGQLGDGTTNHKSVATQVLNLVSVRGFTATRQIAIAQIRGSSGSQYHEYSWGATGPLSGRYEDVGSWLPIKAVAAPSTGDVPFEEISSYTLGSPCIVARSSDNRIFWFPYTGVSGLNTSYFGWWHDSSGSRFSSQNTLQLVKCIDVTRDSIVTVNNVGEMWGMGDGMIMSPWVYGSTISTPIKIVPDKSFVYFTLSSGSGYGSVHAIDNYGCLWAWGDNPSGILGNGQTSDVSSPTQIGARSDWVYLWSFKSQMLGLCADDTMWAWGNLYSGPLTTFNYGAYSSPVFIAEISNKGIIDIVCNMGSLIIKNYDR